MKKTSVEFRTTDPLLQKIYDQAEIVCRGNIKDFDGRTVLVEGAGYLSMWPETQPMAGEMYAKRDLAIAVTNQTIFLDYQRPDGRLPGMLHVNTTADVENQPEDIVVEPIGVTASYGWLQGCCYPRHALHMYYLAELDKAYLERLYDAFSRYDDYLWRVRDSDGDGCLELWCEWDAGEDNAARLRGLPHGWGADYPPEGRAPAPIESMDLMGYSHITRRVLAEISRLLGNGEEETWRRKAEEVAQKVHDYLWIDEKNACYDRDCNNEFMDILLHNNLRLMYYEVFSQDMADRFVKYHLKNPDEFWTPMPLPSVAANDPVYEGTSGNSWAGHPQGLTYQRAIIALENYGYVAELTYLGRKLTQAIGTDCAFSQQYDTFTMEPNGPKEWTYGPTTLAFLEYTSRMYGVHMTPDEIYWDAVESAHDWCYTQVWGEDRYTVEKTGDVAKAFINDRLLFTFTPGFRIVTDKKGILLRAVRIEDSDGVLRINDLDHGTFAGNETCSLVR